MQRAVTAVKGMPAAHDDGNTQLSFQTVRTEQISPYLQNLKPSGVLFVRVALSTPANSEQRKELHTQVAAAGRANRLVELNADNFFRYREKSERTAELFGDAPSLKRKQPAAVTQLGRGYDVERQDVILVEGTADQIRLTLTDLAKRPNVELAMPTQTSGTWIKALRDGHVEPEMLYELAGDRGGAQLGAPPVAPPAPTAGTPQDRIAVDAKKSDRMRRSTADGAEKEDKAGTSAFGSGPARTRSKDASAPASSATAESATAKTAAAGPAAPKSAAARSAVARSAAASPAAASPAAGGSAPSQSMAWQSTPAANSPLPQVTPNQTLAQKKPVGEVEEETPGKKALAKKTPAKNAAGIRSAGEAAEKDDLAKSTFAGSPVAGQQGMDAPRSQRRGDKEDQVNLLKQQVVARLDALGLQAQPGRRPAVIVLFRLRPDSQQAGQQQGGENDNQAQPKK